MLMRAYYLRCSCTMKNILVFLGLFGIGIYSFSLEEQYNLVSRRSRHLIFPDQSSIGLLVAFAIPLELLDQSVIFSYNIEASYGLPGDAADTHFFQPLRSFEGFNRTYLYSLFEKKLSSFGMDGHGCLLRLICEIAISPVYHNGLLGDLIHIIFSPSSSEGENLIDEELAEMQGRDGGNCSSTFYSCPYSLIDAVSFFAD